MCQKFFSAQIGFLIHKIKTIKFFNLLENDLIIHKIKKFEFQPTGEFVFN
jgi:hypothetical protein